MGMSGSGGVKGWLVVGLCLGLLVLWTGEAEGVAGIGGRPGRSKAGVDALHPGAGGQGRGLVAAADAGPAAPDAPAAKRMFRVPLGIKRVKRVRLMLAVAPFKVFKAKGGIGSQTRIAGRVARRLRSLFRLLVGVTRVISPRANLERPPMDGIDLGTFYFNAWSRIGAQRLVKGAVRGAGKGRFEVLLRLYDVTLSRLVLRTRVKVTNRTLERGTRILADRVYKVLTGSRGIFTTRIAFVRRNRKGAKDIWVMPFGGGRARRVVSNGSINVLPSWSPDGMSLLYTSYLRGRPDIYRKDLRTGRSVRLTATRGTATGAVWSPDGSRIAVTMSGRSTEADSDIFVMRGNGKGLKRLTGAWGIDASPSWSPKGRLMAFVSQRHVNPQIFMMRSSGADQKRLTFFGDYNQEPRWCPSGGGILFTGRDEFLKYDLFLLHLDRKGNVIKDGRQNPQRLTQNQGSNFGATWSPDGLMILFVSTRFGERKLFLMSADGVYQRLLVRTRGDYETPAWSAPLGWGGPKRVVARRRRVRGRPPRGRAARRGSRSAAREGATVGRKKAATKGPGDGGKAGAKGRKAVAKRRRGAAGKGKGRSKLPGARKSPARKASVAGDRGGDADDDDDDDDDDD